MDGVAHIREAPHRDIAVDFLKWLHPPGPWAITAIVPDGTTITKVFDPDAEAELRAFIAEHDGKRNLYYTLNEPRPDITKKALKADIVRAPFLHVDIDPEGDETPAEAKARALAALEAHDPKPSAIVDSGNGIQALWRLAEPVELDGPEATASVEDRNKALLEHFGGDKGTQNVDRLLRLPGTTNLPTKKKRENARVPCLSSLVRADGSAHPLQAFPKAEGTKKSDSTESTGTTGGVGGSDDVEALLAQPGADRSARFFKAVVAATDAGMSRDTFEEIALRHPDGCAEKFIEENRLRQEIDRAWTRVESDRAAILDGMNAEFFVVAPGGKARVGRFKPGPNGEELVLYTFEDFKKLYHAPRVGKTGRGAYWLGSSRRRQYDGIVFRPGEPQPASWRVGYHMYQQAKLPAA